MRATFEWESVKKIREVYSSTKLNVATIEVSGNEAHRFQSGQSFSAF